MTFIDLTHNFASVMPVWPGDPEPEFMSIASLKSDQYADTQVTTGMHVGTHIDAPAHIVWGGKRLNDYSVDRFVGRGVLIDGRKRRQIGATLLRDIELKPGDMVIVLTDWSSKFGEPSYYQDYPFLTEDFAEVLIAANVSFVGLDTPGPDAMTDSDDDDKFPIHRSLLEADILIGENLNHLDQLANVKEFEVIALPIKFATESAPARIIARIV